jgi:hypothetical protein
MRRESTPAAASVRSMSLPSDAPVSNVILSFSSVARSASASGTTLASPARVKPLMPTVMPSLMWSAASSAPTTRPHNDLSPMRSRYT